jgi:hypothetical protein
VTDDRLIKHGAFMQCKHSIENYDTGSEVKIDQYFRQFCNRDNSMAFYAVNNLVVIYDRLQKVLLFVSRVFIFHLHENYPKDKTTTGDVNLFLFMRDPHNLQHSVECPFNSRYRRKEKEIGLRRIP